MMRAVWFFVLILLVVTPQRVCTCQHEHHAHVPMAHSDSPDESSCLTADSEQDCDCHCKTRIGDAPKRVEVQLDDLLDLLPVGIATDRSLSQAVYSKFFQQDHIPPAVPLYLSTARLRP